MAEKKTYKPSDRDLKILKNRNAKLFDEAQTVYGLIRDYYNMENRTIDEVNTKYAIYDLIHERFDEFYANCFIEIAKCDQEYGKINEKATKIKKNGSEEDYQEFIKENEWEIDEIARHSLALGYLLGTTQKYIHFLESDDQAFEVVKSDNFGSGDSLFEVAERIDYNRINYQLFACDELVALYNQFVSVDDEDDSTPNR